MSLPRLLAAYAVVFVGWALVVAAIVLGPERGWGVLAIFCAGVAALFAGNRLLASARRDG